MTLADAGGLGTVLFLLVALGIALGFEFVNGFHDTANAVATVIYTKSLSPRKAVLWSGLCNFLGVYLGGIGVAFSIVYLLPVDLLIEVGSGAGMAMVLALLTAAIAWNFGTWWLALPASSSHTLIGAILGVGLASSTLPGRVFGSGVNWHKAAEVGLSLLISPMIGFGVAAVLLLVVRRLAPRSDLHQPPNDRPPPPFVRLVLWITCTGVSFAHGSNDGQKGIGLIMLILIGILPAHYALNLDYSPEQIEDAARTAAELHHLTPAAAAELRDNLDQIRSALAGKASMSELPAADRLAVRKRILSANNALQALQQQGGLKVEDAARLDALRGRLRSATDYAPTWVLLAVALSLGVGTTVGWKRIVVTVGEKIGKTHMTYAQGAVAEVVAMSAIGAADGFGWPVSTTHVLASGVAGTMFANRSGLQAGTVRKIALAWLLTLPAAVLLAGGLFLLFRLFT